jgi:peptidase M48-like protein
MSSGSCTAAPSAKPEGLNEGRPAGVDTSSAWFWLLATSSVALILLPLVQIYLNPSQWTATWIRDLQRAPNSEAAADIRVFEIIITAIPFVAMAVLFAASYALRGRSLNQALQRGRATSWRLRPAAAVLPSIIPLLHAEMLPLLGEHGGRTEVLIERGCATTSVLGDGRQSWLLLSSALVTGLMRREPHAQFILRHEAAHIRNGDHRSSGWIQSLLVAAAIAWSLFLLPASFGLLLERNAKVHEIVGTFGEDIAAVVLGFTLLLGYRAFMRQRELDADSAALDGQPSLRTWLILSLERQIAGGSARQGARGLLTFHPDLGHRRDHAYDRLRRLEPSGLLIFFAGFWSAILSAWGSLGSLADVDSAIAVLQSPNSPLPPGAEAAFSRMAAEFYTYPPRVVATLLAACLLSIELSRLVGSGERWRSRFPAVAVRFALGALVGVMLMSAKAFTATLLQHIVAPAASGGAATYPLALLYDVLGTALTIALAFPNVAASLTLTRVLLRFLERTHLARNPSRWPIPPCVLGLVLVPLAVATFLGLVRFSSLDIRHIPSAVLFPFILSIALTLGAELFRRLRRIRSGPMHATTKVMAPRRRSVIVRSLIGAFGGTFLSWYGILMALALSRPEQIVANYRAGRVAFLLIGSLMGFVTASGVASLASRPRAWPWVSWGVLPTLATFGYLQPALAMILLPPVAIVLGFHIADRLGAEGSTVDHFLIRSVIVLGVVAAIAGWMGWWTAVRLSQMGGVMAPTLGQSMGLAGGARTPETEATRAVGDVLLFAIPVVLAIMSHQRYAGRVDPPPATVVV